MSRNNDHTTGNLFIFTTKIITNSLAWTYQDKINTTIPQKIS